MTQKEALKNMIETFDSERFAIKFVCEWLQDINWHSECALLWGKVCSADQDFLDNLEMVHMATQGAGHYSESYIKELRADPDMMKAVADYDAGADYIRYKGYHFTREQLREIAKTNYYLPFNYAFGWGLCDCGVENGWQFDRGEDFVNELLAIIKPIFEDKESTRRAYASLND